MDVCPKCGTEVWAGASNCANCGQVFSSEIKPVATDRAWAQVAPSASTGPGERSDPTVGTLLNLWRGNVELPETYWKYGFAGGAGIFLLVFIAEKAFESTLVAPLTLLVQWAWLVFIGVSIWRSAGKYSESKLWSVLARIVVVAAALNLLLVSVHVLSPSP
jgi:hypothetical protein